MDLKTSILMLVSIMSVGNTAVAAANLDPASSQLPNFRNRTQGPVGILTMANGAPVEYRDTILLNADMIQNEFFMEAISHQMLERIPERVVHAKGAGAFGYFEVTHNFTDICRASLFEKIGKKTRVFVRFSQSGGDKGESDLLTDSRGFAIKFYTDEGIFDIVGFHTPLFLYKEPYLFAPIGRVIRRNPVTNLRDPNMLWDFIGLNPESLPFFLYLHGDKGIPDGYRHMPGFGVHTYQVYTKYGKSYFIRFHFLPNKEKYLLPEEAMATGCTDPDYAVRDLYNAIENGEYPSWNVKVQVLSFEDVRNCKFDPFDITKILPEDKYPLRSLGKLVLDRNPTNYHADVEQAAFCPGNLIRGILGGPDNAFKSRQLAYKMTQRYRLGVNFQKIKVNCPFNKVYTYDRDGYAPLGDNGADGPNYYPNSFNGPVPYVDNHKPRLVKIKQYNDETNFEQATEGYIILTRDQQLRLANNIVSTLRFATKDVQDRLIALLKLVHIQLAIDTITALTGARK